MRNNCLIYQTLDVEAGKTEEQVSYRINEETTVSYNGKEVVITHPDNYWGREETSSVPNKNIPLLIKALQDIHMEISYDNW